LGISLTKGLYHCWRCEFSGMLPPGVSLDSARAAFHEDHPEEAASLTQEREIPRYTPLTPTGGGTLAQVARAYLHSRGLTDADIEERELGLSEAHPWSVVFPFRLDGMLVYYAARTFREGLPETDKRWTFPRKSKDWPGKSQLVYGIDRVKPGGRVVVVEGILDAIVVPGASVALLGTFPSIPQVEMVLAKKPRLIQVMLDGDVPEPSLLSVTRRFGIAARAVRCPDGLDPADIGREGCRKLLMG